MNVAPNVFGETKEFANFQEAALHVKSVFDRTKTDKNIPSAKIQCQFRGRIFRGIKVDQQIDVLLHKVANTMPPENLDFFKRLNKGPVINPIDADQKEVYQIKLTSSTVTKNEMNEFKRRIIDLGLAVNLVVHNGWFSPDHKTDDDLIPEGLLHYFPNIKSK